MPWHGNVRELENCIHRAVVLARGERIEAGDLGLDEATPVERGTAVSGPLVGRTVAEVERQMIVDTLRHTLGNRTHAASILGISIRTLRNKLRDYAEAGVALSPAGERTA
jgi:DNA-binding NtrC family response regulator